MKAVKLLAEHEIIWTQDSYQKHHTLLKNANLSKLDWSVGFIALQCFCLYMTAGLYSRLIYIDTRTLLTSSVHSVWKFK